MLGLRRKSLILGLMLYFLALPATAGELSILINGKAKHLDPPSGANLNESNWGAGLHYDYQRNSRQWAPFLTASGFTDSLNKWSYYAGGGYMHRWRLNKTWHADAGWVAFIMHRDNVNNGKPFPGILPAFSFGTQHVSINATYIPKVYPKMVALIFFQLKIKLPK